MNPQPEPRHGASRALILLPLMIFAALAALFLFRLQAGDASRIPSALVGRPAPAFALPLLEGIGLPGLSDADMRAGAPSVLNVFASWCAPCRAEHPYLMRLADELPGLAGARLFGLAYKDDPANAKQFLDALGNPFSRIGVDRSGRVGIDFGVYGVPETFVIRADGTIAYKHVGPILDEEAYATLKTEIAKAGR